MNALCLFDIDGTLVRRTGPYHREALIAGVHKVLKRETTTEGIPVHGMLDQDIITKMLLREGLRNREIAEALPAIRKAAERHYLRSVPDLRRCVCPGARKLLYRLQRKGVGLALVTGNFTRIGWKKLEQAGVAHYFAFGAFAEMAKTRAGLAKMAIRQAKESGWITKGAAIALIGDAPSDIRAARANRIRSVAVATGISTREELSSHMPDELLEDLHSFSYL